MYLLSRVKKYPATGRLLSVVISRAALNGSPTAFTYTLRVSFHGFRNAMYWPLGEICAPAISGFPKRSSRSISGGKPFVFLSCARTAVASSNKQMKPQKNLFMDYKSLLDGWMVSTDSEG